MWATRVDELRRLVGGLEEFDWVAVGIFDLDLAAAGAAFDLVAEGDAGGSHLGDGGFEVVHAEDDAVVSAGLLLTTTGKGSSAGTAGSAEQDAESVAGDAGEGRAGLHVEFESEEAGVETDGTIYVADLITNRPKTHSLLLVSWNGCWDVRARLNCARRFGM